MIYKSILLCGMSHCTFISLIQDVAWLMTQHVVKNGAEHYGIAIQNWQQCEYKLSFTKQRVDFVLRGMNLILREMPQNDVSVVYILQFVTNISSQINEYANKNDRNGAYEDYDHAVLDPAMTTYVKRRPGA